MKDDVRQNRILAVQRFRNGEKPETICASLGCSRAWLYKWIDRYSADDPTWCNDQSRRPVAMTARTPQEVEEIIKLIRLNLYNQD